MAKSKQIAPTAADQVFQSHKISRAAYDLPVMARRLVYVAMAQVRPTDESLPVIEMSVGAVVRALGLSDQGNRYEEVRAAVRILMGSVLEIETTTGWSMRHWVDKADYVKKTDTLQIKISDELREDVLECQRLFSIFALADVGRLQGKYSLRLFEIVMSRKGQEGTQGNKAGHWYADLEFSNLRALFKIGPSEYALTRDFRLRVIDGPVREINEAGLGLRIECDYDKFRIGRCLIGVRLNCRSIARDEPRPVSPATKSEMDDEALIAGHQEQFDLFLKRELAQGDFSDMRKGFSREQIASTAALKALREWHRMQSKKGKRRT